MACAAYAHWAVVLKLGGKRVTPLNPSLAPRHLFHPARLYYRDMPHRLCLCLALLSSAGAGFAQVIEYESGGVKHQTLTRNGVTLNFATTHSHVRDYAMIQIAVANGSDVYANIRPEDFTFARADGQIVRAAPADDVVRDLLDRGSLGDVQKLVVAYENNLYGISNMRITNGYEQRRRNAMAEGVPAKFKAAAAASALALVPTRLAPGQSTDGAVFFPMEHKLLGGGKLIVHSGNETYEFNATQ